MALILFGSSGIAYGNVYYWRSLYYKEVNEAYFEMEKRMKQRPDLYQFSENDVAKNFGQNRFNNGADDDADPRLEDMPEPSIFDGHEHEKQDLEKVFLKRFV